MRNNITQAGLTKTVSGLYSTSDADGLADLLVDRHV
jgi:hypothetical protein